MTVQTEDMRVKNHWMISSSYDIQAHQQHSQRWCCLSNIAVRQFEVLAGWSPALPSLSNAHPDPPLVVTRPLISSLTVHSHSLVHLKGHCIGPINSGICPPWDSGLTTAKHSQSLPVTKIHVADKLNTFCQWWCSETDELEGREPIINAPPHLSPHSKENSWERVVLAQGV